MSKYLHFAYVLIIAGFSLLAYCNKGKLTHECKIDSVQVTKIDTLLIKSDTVFTRVSYPVNRIIRDTIWIQDSTGEIKQKDTTVFYANESIRDTAFNFFNVGAKSHGRIIGIDVNYKLKDRQVITKTITTKVINTIISEKGDIAIMPSVLYFEDKLLPVIGFRYKKFFIAGGYYPEAQEVKNGLLIQLGYEIWLK